jgi:hypothetical protein
MDDDSEDSNSCRSDCSGCFYAFQLCYGCRQCDATDCDGFCEFEDAEIGLKKTFMGRGSGRLRGAKAAAWAPRLREEVEAPRSARRERRRRGGGGGGGGGGFGRDRGGGNHVAEA